MLTFIAMNISAYDFLRPVKGQILVVTTSGYTRHRIISIHWKTPPVIIFLHGASLCGHDLNRAPLRTS